MSDTPRTDAAEQAFFEDDGIARAVFADFARELERENTRLRDALQTVLSDAELETRHGGQLFTDTDPIRRLLFQKG